MMECEQILNFDSLYTRPTTPVVVKWMRLFEEEKLSTTDFRDHWKIWVPKAFTPEHNSNCLEWTVKDSAQELLYDTLEEFICNGDKNVIFKYLTNTDTPPSVCGKVFKMGEPTYNCRQCGMDATCVLCVDCFKLSDHKNHKYRMGTSGGGGCCDCGDAEAWKTGAYCKTHIQGLKKPDESKTSYKLPDDFIRRTEVVFTSVLRYAYQILTLEYSPSLPSDLRPFERNDPENLLSSVWDTDQFCTVLYNDETHTFEQVINTLARVIKCSQRDAIEFVTNIDREGRTVVKASTFQHCAELKSDIEKFTSKHGSRPLKVLIVHAYVIAHQIFALGLLTWLQKLTALAEVFRSVFSRVVLGEVDHSEPCIIDGILQRDYLLWKSARLHWHRLFISGMFMEYSSKKSFAQHFTKLYGSIMKEFIRDDHDHSFSVASLSIQVFTVPTLAQYLIAQHDVLFILLNTLISECLSNRLGKLQFDRTAPTGPFKRASYILYDLRYLLSLPPDSWTEELRKGFMRGISLVLTFLTYMQGMDSVTRQVGQHMEYEPEWESAFNLHLKLAPVITLLIKWCSTDETVLIRAYRHTLRKLYEDSNFENNHYSEVQELADHSASCLNYDVSSQPVSIHLPLSRFLAGLHLYLEKFDLHYGSAKFYALAKLSPEQIIEPVLRTQVMIAQVHAGMWRRNGYSLSNQIYFYHNVKCRGEMLDRDIVILQMGASLIESNEFLIHVLNKYGLLSWANKDFETTVSRSPEEDGMKQTINMVEEFLSLLIVIVGERYVPGVGKVTSDDCIKNEIIHQLFIKPLTHSEVNKALPDDINHETGMERVIDEVADFKKPSQPSGRGVYEIKKQYLDKYNVFFYHYTKEELSKSEEVQRKLRKEENGLECCPPPVLPQFNDPFSMVANVLQCDVMLHIMNVVLERSVNLRARSFSEAQLHKVLHLIGYALHEEEQKYYSFFTFTKRAVKWNIESLLEELSSSPRVDAHKDLIKWTLKKWRQVAAPAADTSMEVVSDASSSNSKMSEALEKEFRAKLAAERRAALMALMSTMQQNFMKDNADLFEEASSSKTNMGESGISGVSPPPIIDTTPVALGQKQSAKASDERKFTCILCQEDQVITADGPAMVLAAFVQKSTVLHRQKISPWSTDASEFSNGLFLSSSMAPAPHASTCGHVMHSACWKKYIETIQTKENRRPYRLRTPTSFDIEKNEYLCPLCECLNNTVLPIIPLLHTLPNAYSKEPVDKLSFANWYEASIIAISHKQKADKKVADRIKQEFSMWTEDTTEEFEDAGMKDPPPADGSKTISVTCFSSPPSQSQCGGRTMARLESGSQSDETDDEETVQVDQSFSGFNAIVPLAETDVYMQLRVYQGVEAEKKEGDEKRAPDCGLSDDLLDMIYLFSQVAFTKGLFVNPDEEDPSVPMMAWKACAYTIHALETLLRFTEKPLLGDFTCRQQDVLENLIRLSGVLGTAWKQKHVINRHGVKLLTMVIDNDSTDPSVCDWDCFGLLVPLTSTFPSMFYSDPVPVPSGSALELHSFNLMFLSQIAQIIICSDVTTGVDNPEECIEDMITEETKCLSQVVRAFKDITAINTDVIWQIIKSKSIVFLRCAAIFYHFLTGVQAPEELMVVGGDTFENLCKYLGISHSCGDLLDHPHVMSLFNTWASHESIMKLRNVFENTRDMMPLNELVSLPDDYSELINTVSLFTCPNSDREDSRNPTMCLICGEMLCSQTYCCQTELNKLLVGACTYHTHKCGAGAGIFLRVRECEILLLASPNKGCFRAPPYIDDYGEADQGLRRGNPLHLCRESYRKLQLLWLSHGIYEEIARAIEFSHSLIPTQWQHL